MLLLKLRFCVKSKNPVEVVYSLSSEEKTIKPTLRPTKIGFVTPGEVNDPCNWKPNPRLSFFSLKSFCGTPIKRDPPIVCACIPMVKINSIIAE
jgi:hypothetical protein